MYLLLWIFPLSTLLATAATAACWTRWTYRALPTQRCGAVLLGLGLSYLIALVMVCWDPYFTDNEVDEFIAWPQRWAWAALFAGMLQWLLVPVTLVTHHFWRKIRRG